jgi:hypothetical protein
MKGRPPQHALVEALSRPRSAWRVLWAATSVTAIVTLLSLSELSQLIQKGNPVAEARDWRAVAGRAVKHAENLPRLPHLQRRGGSGGPGAAYARLRVVPP